MAQTLHSADDVPQTRRPQLHWVLMAIVGALCVVYGLRVATTDLRAPVAAPAGVTGAAGAIRTYGSLPALLKGDTGPKVALTDLATTPGAIAIGSLAGLQGEIAVVRGVRWISYAQESGEIVVEQEPGAARSAGFLAAAEIPSWHEQRLEAAVPFDRLAAELEAGSRRAGVVTDRPFPVLIEGTFTAIQLNVAAGPGDTPDKPKQLKESVATARGSIVGFFATEGGERFIHVGKQAHLHVVLPEARKVGHLDSVQLEPGTIISFPVNR